MAVSVNMPHQKQREPEEKDPLDRVLKALGIASTVFGIKDAFTKSEMLKQSSLRDQQKADFEASGGLTPKDALQYGDKYSFTEKQKPGSLPFKMKGDDGGLKSVFATPRPKEVDPVLQAYRHQKTQELSAPQAKQLSLYESGSLAEKQYRAATSDKDKYDPTSKWQVLNQSSLMPDFAKGAKPLEAEKAQDVWVEAFLRDASGAVIPDSERGPYKSLFFPQAGDTPEIVANKLELREQKMQNALSAAGGMAQLKVASQPKAPITNNLGTLPSGKPILSPEQAQQMIIEKLGISSGLKNRKK